MLEIKNLSKAYGDHVIFKDLNLTIADGEILTIVGPSGIGKTTFLRILAGLLPADSGTMTLDGKELALDGNRTGADVGVIFQDFNLFPQYSVAQNIGLAPKLVAHQTPDEVHTHVNRLMQELDLQDQSDQYPFELSGGQKQRVAIARALAMNPGILAYDEPTSGLDAASTQRVTAVTQELQAKGVTQLIVTHDLPFADSLDSTIFDFATDVKR
ncbi:polar amino acid transport system ATP-binding protein [Weissella uvarum]|uniref:amino acid ABC transporter ATP-binding protein n=1 Tax=Weissella uvarum TaxID=1479233 RepID=UPI0019620270|nr:ATP-binding cassette domain-containing protein [Weissella uvarum]MBM7617808.1 polar amino acid transport system ATP-binding protein [Weissella uvarum]MCM0595813.1 amino acid ABC transporter ATP-binding protein [Weissella uvarum]